MVDSVIHEASKLCLDNWTALNLAIDMGWGEETEKETFINELANYILHFEVDQHDITNFLEDFMEQKFSVILEDDSAKDIARILVKVYQESWTGASEEISRLRALRVVDTELCQKVQKVEQGEEMEIDPPVLVDEDGFEMVVSKKQRKNK